MTRSIFANLSAAAAGAVMAVTTAAAAHAATANDDCMTQATPPPAPPAAMARAVGQYGDGQSLLDLSEHCGTLVLDGRGFKAAALTPAGPGRYTVELGGAATSVAATPDGGLILGDERLPRRDIGAETEARVRAGAKTDADKLRAAALAATPPNEPPPRRSSDLVSVPALDPAIRIHTLYAGTDNFMGIRIYERAGAYLQRPAAEAVARAARALRDQGLGLMITDAYRPWFATRMFWDATPPEDHNFVADPAQGSRHNRGCAVDLTLYDLKTGRPVEMPGHVDEMSARSAADYPGGASRQRWYRAVLRRAMEREGFAVYSDEWWHFDYKDWADYAIGVATYTQLAAGQAH